MISMGIIAHEISLRLHIFAGDDGKLTQTMARLDDALARYGVDTTSCMQRAVCTYSKQAVEAVREHAEGRNEEDVSSLDKAIDAVTSNQVFHSAMEGTAVQEAIQAGREGRDCPRVYSHCGLSLEAILALFTTMMTAPSPTNLRAPTGTSAL